MNTQSNSSGRGLAPDTPFLIEIEHRPNGVIARLSGSCTMEVSSTLGECLVELASEQPHVIVLEMSSLDFIESTGLGGIIAGYLRCRRQQGEVRLVAPQESILALLQLTRLTQLFRIFDTIEDALGAEVSDP